LVVDGSWMDGWMGDVISNHMIQGKMSFIVVDVIFHEDFGDV
jgi:hypothetical protein